jgi:hypothetical protein
VVVLDQFEELFLRVGSRQRAAFFQELADALDRPEREVRFVFSLREDYLARLDETRVYLPDIFSNSYRLATLDRSNARLAITEPAGRAGVMVEPALVDALVGREGAEASKPGDLVESDRTVPPPALQIVMDRLYRAALLPGHDPHKPPPSGLTLTLTSYQQMNGAGAILADYVGDGLEMLSDLKGDDGAPLGADPVLGEAMLKVMVTSQRTKAVLSQADLLEGLAEAGALDPEDPADCQLAERTRRGLERVRLLRGFQREGQAFYELAHDHLAAEIATRISEEEMGAKLARELLRRQMDN